MNRTIFFRADHELVGRVLAEKLRRRTEWFAMHDSFSVSAPRERAGAVGVADVEKRPWLVRRAA